MEYLGVDTYKIYLSDKDLILTKYEIEQIVESYNSYQENLYDNTNNNSINLFKLPKRQYNNNEKIKLLFKSYYQITKTKKEVFLIIAKELNITIKAVEKAYYRK